MTYYELYEQDSVSKTIKITDNDITLTDANIWENEFSIEQTLCDEQQIRFGCCNASVLTIKIINNCVTLRNRELAITQTLESMEEPFKLGTYYIDSDRPTADRNYRDIVGYDFMYYIINANVADWYNNLNFPLSLREFRCSFFDYMGIRQEDVILVNDNMQVERTISGDEISGKMIIEAICEINGAFGHMGYDSVFEYITLNIARAGLYPSETLYPNEDLYPQTNESDKLEGTYKDCQYEDYIVNRFTKLQIRETKDDIGAISGDGDNCYIVQDNFLLYGKTAEELQQVADNMFSVIQNMSSHTPLTCNTKGNPARELGRSITLSTKNAVVSTYILKRTLTGVQALNDCYETKGTEFYEGDVNGTSKAIIKLEKKTNSLIRNVEKNVLEIKNIESNLKNNYSTTIEMTSAIVQSAKEISLSVSETYETKNDAQSQYNTFSSAIKQTAGQIELKVDADGIIAAINLSKETATISADKINLQGIVTFISDSGYVTENDLGVNGTTVINGGRIDTESLFSREITATNLKLTGNSSLQLGANNTNEKQFIYLVGLHEGIVNETGLFPSRFYTVSADGYSMNITAQSIAFGNKNGSTLLISSGEDGVVNYSARLSHEFLGDMVIHNRLMYIAGSAYHDIIKIIQNNIILGNLVDYTE